MSKTDASTLPASLGEERCRELVIRFLADLLQITGPLTNQDELQAALQGYCDSLRPWLESSDAPSHPRAVFSLFEELTMDATGEHLTVVLSPEGEACFRAWLRRHQVWRKAGCNTAHAWLH